MRGYGKAVELEMGFDQAVDRVREVLAAQGFGVLTEIDVQATLRAKLDAEMERYLILGACNPQLAHRALEVTRDVGLLLPCNVVVREQDSGVVVQFLDPGVISELTGLPELEPVASEATRRIDAALAALRGGAAA